MVTFDFVCETVHTAVHGDGCLTTVLLCLQLNLWRYGDFTADDAPEFGM